ncbi:LacI family DNA-binding transcriptional regulator [Vibrio metschnikovii]
MMKDVARLAGVSTTTVSHVINKTRFVAETTQEKVLDAVKQLNYAPSAVARSLKCNTTRTIGMLVTQSTNLFFLEVIDGVESYCYRQGYTLILCNTGVSTRNNVTIFACLLKSGSTVCWSCARFNGRVT